ncbi:hypothetical protein D3C87_1560470 [compost metagenome]
MLKVDPMAALAQMQSVLRHRSGREAWAARAHGCERFAYGSTPEEAMTGALNIAAQEVGAENVRPRRREIIEQIDLPIFRKRVIE